MFPLKLSHHQGFLVFELPLDHFLRFLNYTKESDQVEAQKPLMMAQFEPKHM
jgi:hypothetical protein